MGKSKEFIIRHKKLLIYAVAVLSLLVLGAIITCWLIISHYKSYVFYDYAGLAKAGTRPVAIVFGGGIENKKPRPLLQDRLDAAAELYHDNKISKLIVSGDNRFLNYNEPQAMRDYLVKEKHLPAKDIQVDYAGRSTYESCERARKVFLLDKAVLISESTHLPRAVYLCRSFGVEAYGYASDGQAAGNLQLSQNFRELFARVKAVLNVYVWGEKTVLGKPIPVK